MQRGNKILLAGIIILVSSAIIFGLSAYKAILMIENFPDISAKGLADKATEKLADKVTDRINASAKIPDRLADRVTASINAFLSTSTDTEDVYSKY